MGKNVLHITNGSSLTDYLRELDFKGDFLTWQEMLCEGPTIAHIDSDKFFEIRKEFLTKTYEVEVDEKELRLELSKLDETDRYDEIVLWFEYDLFCHINMIGVISLLHQKEIDLPLYHVCSGRVAGEKELKGLAELSHTQIQEHYKSRIRLAPSDKDLAVSLWRIYCGKDHNLFKPYIVQPSSFKYLSNCLKAHMKRFPDSKSGLDAMEANILKMIRDKEIKSKHHLLGYALNYQGYYGYGDLQFIRIIENLSVLYDETEERLLLNRNGHEALMRFQNFAGAVNNAITFGGVDRLDFEYSKTEAKLIKSAINAY